MIRNRYNYLTPSIQGLMEEKEGRTQSNGTTAKTPQAESQKDSLFPEQPAKRPSKIKQLPGHTWKDTQ